MACRPKTKWNFNVFATKKDLFLGTENTVRFSNAQVMACRPTTKWNFTGFVTKNSKKRSKTLKNTQKMTKFWLCVLNLYDLFLV